MNSGLTSRKIVCTYLMLANKDTGAYQVTGKIEQLYAVLQFLDENEVIPDSEVDEAGANGAEGTAGAC